MHGRYALYPTQTLGVGAAATVHLGVARGRELVPVAIKRLHDRHAREASAVARLLDEVRLARRVVHPNVVRVIDFVSDGEEMLAVMEYVHGEPLSRLLADVKKSGEQMPMAIAAAIACDVLRGLHAAHEATDVDGKPLGLVHRDVTPENILVGADGLARLMDFGVAKAQGRLHLTKDGGVRGKLAYLAPEQVGGDVTARTDLYAVGLVLWEMLVGERVIQGESEPELLVKALDPNIAAPSTRVSGVPPALDKAILRALCKEPDGRFETGNDEADAIERAVRITAGSSEVSAWVRVHAGERLAARDVIVREMLAAEAETASPARASSAPPSVPPSGAVLTAEASVQPSARDSHARGFALMAFATLAVVVAYLLLRTGDVAATTSPPLDSASASPSPPASASASASALASAPAPALASASAPAKP
ncbi:MAG: protein kinase, partial [Myxococcaceae bacterium]|nr:protein kinase [Myxococcaceae bacterium]